MNQEVTTTLILQILNKVIRTVPYQAFIWAIIIDVITGIGKAVRLKKLDSTLSTNGMIRHIVVILIVTLFSVYGRILGFEGYAGAIGFFYIASYGISIIENADAMGLNVPSWISQYFNRMRADYDQKLNHKAPQGKDYNDFEL